MAGIKSTAAPTALVPAFVHGLNAMASKLGLSVDVGTHDPKGDEPWDSEGPRLVAIWSGSVKQIRETGIFPSLYRFPDKGFGRFRFTRHRRGLVEKQGRAWRIYLDCDEIPARIEKRGDIEVVYYSDRTAYYGTGEALLAAGCCTKAQLASGKRLIKSSHGYDKRSWINRRFHDGTFIHEVENEAVFKERAESFERHCAQFRAEHSRPLAQAVRGVTQSHSVSWSKRLSACCALLTRVESEIQEKMRKDGHPTDGGELDRALDDLDAARRAMGSIASEISGGHDQQGDE